MQSKDSIQMIILNNQ